MEYFGRANWAKFLTEYGTVKEGKDLYEIEKQMNKSLESSQINGKTRKLAVKEEVKLSTTREITKLADSETSTTTETGENSTNTNIKGKYPIIENGKIENSSITNTLVETIKTTENIEEITEENVQLYKVDMGLIKLDIKDDYIINIKTGELYKLEGVKYQGKTYHRPDWGVANSGEETQLPNEFTIEASYIEAEEILKIEVLNVINNTQGNIKYEYHIQKVTINEETGEIENTSDQEIVKESENATLEIDCIEDEEVNIESGTYKIWVIVKDKENNEKKSKNEEIVEVERGEIVTTTDSLIIDNPTIVTVGKTITVQVEKQDREEYKKISNSSFIWSIADTNIATINQKGQITGKTLGTTAMTLETKANENKQLIVINVEVKNIKTDIWTKEDLEEFRNNVNSGITYLGLEVNQRADIDLLGNDSNKWTAIGNITKYFKGTYNGNNYKIEGLYINSTAIHQGLFGYTNGATIRNVNVENGYVYTTKHNAGGIIGTGNNITIDNCKFSGSVTTKGYSNTTYDWGNTGGIIGMLSYRGGEITNCTNYGTIEGKHRNTGGIVGFGTKAQISKCINYGEVKSEQLHTGGISGVLGIYNTSLKRYLSGKIDNCENRGIIICNRCYVGGITGLVASTSTVINSNNYGDITGIGRGSDNSSSVNYNIRKCWRNSWLHSYCWRRKNNRKL